MKKSSLFQFQLTRKACGFSEDKLLDALEQNFRRSGCHHQAEKIPNGLLLKREFMEGRYLRNLGNVSWIDWPSMGNICILLEKNEHDNSWIITLTINRRFSIGIFALINLFFGIGYGFTDLNHALGLMAFFNGWFIMVFWLSNRSIRRIIRNTIRYGNAYEHTVKSSYNWDSILSKKSHKELNEIAAGRTLHPPLVVDMARKIIEEKQ